MAIPIPTCIDDLDPTWLGRVLGTPVVARRVAGPTGGMAVTSTVVRLALELAEPAAGPQAVVVKLVNPQWTDGSELHQREVAFYRDFAPRHPLPVPRCYHADFDPDTGRFVLVMEDLSTLSPGHRLDGLTEDEANAVVDGVATLHRAWWQRPELRSLKVRGHDEARIDATLAHLAGRVRAVDARDGFALADEVRELVDTVADGYRAGMLRISRRPQTLIHSDLHVENFFLESTAAGFRLEIIDWQNPCYGNAAFDVGQILTSLAPSSSGCHERLLARYHDRLAAADYTLAELRADTTAAIRHQFVGSLGWFATFAPSSPRDARTMRGHWQRLCAALVAREATARTGR